MKRTNWLALALATTALAPVTAWAGPVLPTGGKVVAGAAAIGAPSGGALSITQSSNKAILNWGSFSIGQGGKVAFDNGKGATLNRVTGQQVSSLDGLLTATGSVYLINPNGVIVGKSGVVNVGGTFVASTLDTSNADFLKGGALSFSGSSDAAVVNYGKIGALGGDVALIAAKVANAGTISAANGDAGLLAGYKVVLKDSSLDDGRFAVELGGAGATATNSGLIEAADAELRAEGGNVYALAGDTAGVIRATGVKSGGGRIWLVADGGTLNGGGTLDAQGAGGTPGSVETSGGVVDIGATRIDAHGGLWSLDPYDLTIDATGASAIDTALNAGTSVTESTSASGTTGVSGPGDGTADANGSGDIIVAAPISWTTTAGLTLSAYRNVDVNAAITASGGGSVAIVTDNSGAGNGGALTFGGLGGGPLAGGAVRFTGSSGGQPTGGFSLNGQGYTLIADLATLSADIAANNTGSYALATSVDGSNNGAGYTQSPLTSTLATPFAGTLEGLGNFVSNLTVNDTANLYVGLFGQIGQTGVVRDISLSGAVSATALLPPYPGQPATEGPIVGALAADNYGQISGVSSSVAVNAGTGAGIYAGGLVGYNEGPISASNASGAVTVQGDGADVGGLAGDNSSFYLLGSLTDVYATGAVTSKGSGGYVGGLVGYNSDPGAPITRAYATGAVAGDDNFSVGGLIGRNDAGTGSGSGAPLSQVYATGDVTGGYIGNLGGLVGENGGGAAPIADAYATGRVSVESTGEGGAIGGLVGQNTGAQISNSYASGAVSNTGPYARTGGLVGFLIAGSVTQSYATGAVTDTGLQSYVGGLIGDIDGNNRGNVASVSNSYASGSVTASDPGTTVGGLVGLNDSDQGQAIISTSYASGLVSDGNVTLGVGGLVGENAGTISGSIWDRTTTGTSVPIGLADAGSSAAVTSVQDTDPTAPDYAFSAAPYMAAGFGFGGLGSGASFVIVDADGGLNNANGAAGGTRPMLLSEYSTSLTNAHQLQLMALDPTANYTLANDIDASGTAGGDVWGPGGFVPVGGNDVPNYNAATNFTGALAGQGHTISGLTIDNTTDVFVGLFGRIGAGGTVTDATITGTVNAGQPSGPNAADVGVLAGFSAGTITGVVTQGTLFGSDPAHHLAAVGGLIGDNNGSVTGSSSSVSVSDGLFSGGLVGLNDYQGVISGSYAEGPVSAGSAQSDQYQAFDAGGLAGVNYGSIASSYATGFVNGGETSTVGHNSVGGLVGGLVIGSVTDSYATGAVQDATAQSQVGGLVGFVGQDVSVTRSYATGQVQGGAGALTGGLAGTVLGGSTVSESYATGAVSGAGGSLGGLIGSNAGTVSNAYAVGAVTNDGSVAGGAVGGLVGANTGTVSGAWASGAVGVGGATGEVDGGFAGSNGGTITAGYYDQGTTGQTSGVGGVADAASGVGAVGGSTGLSPYAMSSYPGLAFGTTPNGDQGHSFVIVDQDSTLNNAGGAAGGTRPFLLSEYSLNVANAHQLQLIALNLNGNYTLANDIDAGSTGASLNAVSSDVWSPAGFVPLGGNGAGFFTGSLIGQDATVSNLTIRNTVSDEVGLFGVIGSLFGVVRSAQVSGINLRTASIAGPNVVGGLAGVSSGTLSDVSISGAVSTNDPQLQGIAGGLAGDNAGSITAATSSASVSAPYASGDAGGLVGLNSATVSQSTASGVINGTTVAGGLIGDNNFGGSVSNSSSSASVVGAAGASSGGLIGENLDGVVGAVHASGTVDGGAYVGGLIGVNQATNGSVNVDGAYATGAVSGATIAAGGLIGLNAATGSHYASVNFSYAAGAVSAAGGAAAGGLVGEQSGSAASVNDAYALGSVTVAGSNGAGGLSQAGGLVGNNATGAIAFAYATGKVSSTGDGLATLGGLVGANTGTVNHGYWDTQTSGQSLDPALSLTGDPATGSIGLTTAQFMDPTGPIGGLGLATSPSETGGQFVIVDVDGSFNGAGGAAGATRPFLLSEAPAVQTVAGFGAFAQIANAHQLQLVGLNLGGTYYAGRIDASATADANPSDMWGAAGFVPIGSGAAPFTGTFSGGEIAGLTVNKAGSYAGLFGAVGAGGVVQDVSLTGASITGGGYVGGMVGDNSGRVSNVLFEGAVKGPSGTGGLVGVNEGGSLIDGSSVNEASVTGGGDDVGGLAGANFGVVSNSSSVAAVTGVDHVGGLVGYNSGPVKDSLGYGAVAGRDYVGGLVGLNYGAVSVNVAYAPSVAGAEYVGGAVGWNDLAGALSGDQSNANLVTASGNYAGGLVGVNKGVVGNGVSASQVTGAGLVGGLVGLNQGSVTGSNDFGPVTGNLYLGGLVGWNDTGATIETSYATGSVTGNAGGQDAFGNDYVGGLVGVNFGAVADTYATGAVSGVQVVGGLVGTNTNPPNGFASVTASYATGSVGASAGAVGSTFGVQAGEVTSVYGFPSLSGQPVESGYVNAGSTGDGSDLTAAQENGSAAYTGFDPNVWQFDPNGPPALKSTSN